MRWWRCQEVQLTANLGIMKSCVCSDITELSVQWVDFELRCVRFWLAFTTITDFLLYFQNTCTLLSFLSLSLFPLSLLRGLSCCHVIILCKFANHITVKACWQYFSLSGGRVSLIPVSRALFWCEIYLQLQKVPLRLSSSCWKKYLAQSWLVDFISARKWLRGSFCIQTRRLFKFRLCCRHYSPDVSGQPLDIL